MFFVRVGASRCRPLQLLPRTLLAPAGAAQTDRCPGSLEHAERPAGTQPPRAPSSASSRRAHEPRAERPLTRSRSGRAQTRVRHGPPQLLRAHLALRATPWATAFARPATAGRATAGSCTTWLGHRRQGDAGLDRGRVARQSPGIAGSCCATITASWSHRHHPGFPEGVGRAAQHNLHGGPRRPEVALEHRRPRRSSARRWCGAGGRSYRCGYCEQRRPPACQGDRFATASPPCRVSVDRRGPVR